MGSPTLLARIPLEIFLSYRAALPLDYVVMDSPLTRPELPAISFLEGMADEDRALLSNYGEFLPVHPQQTLIAEGADQDSLYLVISGLLHVSREKDGSRTLLWRVTPGETIGEVNLFDPAAASADVVAQEFSQIWRANREDLETFVNAYPEVGAYLMVGLARLLSKRLRAMNARLATLQEAITTTPQAWQ
jgi:CRP/FNR family transcriptional regulator, cyclic AMP receptor protein